MTNNNKKKFSVEVTDTFGGEANYCWVQRYVEKATSPISAISSVSRKTGYRFRKCGDYGDIVRYNAVGAAVCAFVEEQGEENDRCD